MTASYAGDTAPVQFASSSGTDTVAINRAPTAVADDYTVNEDTPLTVAAAGVLLNDTDPDSNPLTVATPRPVSGPSNGTLTLNANGSFTYTPNADFFGTDSFTYKASDGSLDSSVATVTITVNDVNDVPSFVKGANQTILDNAGAQTVPGWATSISTGPANENTQTLSFTVTGNTNPAMFSVAPAVSANGTLTYTPAPGVGGTATITLHVKDNGGTANGGVDTSATQTFTITVNLSKFALTVTKNGTGTGTVTSSPAGINCGATCTADFNAGTPVTLTAAASSTSTFEGWSGAGVDAAGGTRTVTMDAAKAVTATFKSNTTLAVGAASGTYGGQVTLSATLTAATGSSALSGRLVSFSLNGNAVGTATTSALGVATLTVSLTSDGTPAGTKTAAGSYPGGVAASFANAADYNGSSAAAALTVAKATASVSLTNLTHVYDGNAKSATATTTPNGLAVTVTYDQNDIPVASPVNVGSYTAFAVVNDPNYEATATATLAITPATTTATVTCTPGPFAYTGGAQTPCSAVVTGPGGLNDPLTVSYDGNTNAGTATASASYAATGNYAASTDSETFTIAPATTTTLVTCTAGPFAYTGAAQTPCSAVVTGPGGLNDSSLSVTYENNTNAGTATASASYAATGNYAASTDSETFTIAPATTTTLVTCAAGPFAYTGAAQTPCSAVVTGPGGLNDSSLSVTYENNTNAGTATASASYAATGNYAASTDSETFTIAPATTTTLVTCTAGPFAYTGAAQTPCSAVVTGPGGLNDSSLPVTYENNTNAGTATASASYAATGNYAASTDSETFTIAPATTTTLVTCTAGPFAYTGAAQTPCSAVVTGPGGLNDSSLSVTYENNTNAGVATASASYAATGNYAASTDSETFTIAPATTTTLVTVSNATFDGTEHGATAQVTGPGGLDTPAAVSYSGRNGTLYSSAIAPTAAGDYTATASYVATANYAASTDSKDFSISKAGSTVTVTCPTTAQTYTGSPLSACTAKASGAGGLDADLTVTYTDNTNVGTAGASATFAGDDNHNGSNNSATFAIAKAALVDGGDLHARQRDLHGQRPGDLLGGGERREPVADPGAGLREQHQRGHGERQLHVCRR